jgi:hypothetical protein
MSPLVQGGQQPIWRVPPPLTKSSLSNLFALILVQTLATAAAAASDGSRES